MSVIVKFLTMLEVQCADDRWIVAHDFGYSVDGEVSIIPAGFKTDFASTPRLPFTYLIAGDVSHKAPLIHDWLYSRRVERKWADRVFMAALKEEGVALWRRSLMYWAVRAFGDLTKRRAP